MTLSERKRQDASGPLSHAVRAPRWAMGGTYRRVILPWLFVLPIVLVHLVIVIGPSIAGLYYALTDWSGIGAAEFVGLDNFRRLFTEDMNFRRAFGHNLMWMAFFLTVPFALALLAASILARIKRGGMLLRALFIIPYVLPSVVSANIWRGLLHPRLGIGAWLAEMGVTGADVAWLGNTKTVLWAIMFAGNWTWWGFLMVLFLAAMQTIPPDLYDAAQLDGANRWQEFRHVTLPGIRPTLIFMLMMSAIWSFMGFDFAWILTQGGPAGASELLATYIYKTAFLRFDAGYATAVGLTVTGISGMIVLLYVALRQRGWEI